MAANETTKKVLNIVLKVFTWLIVALTVCMMIFTIVSVNTFDKNERSIFGIKFYIVKTDSMSLSENNADDDVHFNAGDIVLVKNLDTTEQMNLQPGDVISFISQNTDSFGETITHMVKERKTNKDGQLLGYVTYGTNTGTEDEALVEPGYVLGKYTGKLPAVGHFFQFLKTTPGYIVCILVPFLLLILYQGVNCIAIFRRYKKEQMAEMEEERAKIEEERRQSLEMMQELQALKAQLANQDGATAAAPAEKPAEEAEKPAETTPENTESATTAENRDSSDNAEA